MANEITVQLRFTVAKGYFADSITKTLSDDFPVIGQGGGVQDIGTTEEVLDFGDVAYEGWLYLENLDDTNVIEYGPEDGGAMVFFGKLLPGMGNMLFLKPGTVVRARAWNATSKLFIKCYDTATST